MTDISVIYVPGEDIAKGIPPAERFILHSNTEVSFYQGGSAGDERECKGGKLWEGGGGENPIFFPGRLIIFLGEL